MSNTQQLNSPTSSPSCQVHPEPIPFVEGGNSAEKTAANSGGRALDNTLRMTGGHRKKRFGKIPEPVIIPPPHPIVTAPSPVSPAKSDSFCTEHSLPPDSSSPHTPQSPTKRFVLKPITALTAAFQRSTLSSITGRNKSASTLLKMPKSPKQLSPKLPGSPTGGGSKSPSSPKQPKSPRILHRKGSGGSIRKRNASDSPTRAAAESIFAPNNSSINNSNSQPSTTTTSGGASPKSSFFKSPFSLSTNTSQTSTVPKSPSKLGKFNLRHPKSPHGLSSTCRKALPISPLELGERLGELSDDSNKNNNLLYDENNNYIGGRQQQRRLPKPILIDVRNLAVYQEAHICNSFNVNLPTLLIKRYRRGNVSNFSLDNFITTPEGRDKYLDTVQEEGGKQAHDVIVFDETMDESDKISPGWTLLGVLERAMLQSVSSENINECNDVKGKVYWLKGGFEAFRAWDQRKKFIVHGLESWPATESSDTVSNSEHSVDNSSSMDIEGLAAPTGSGLVRRDSLFSVNTEQSSLRRKRSEQKEKKQQASNNEEKVKEQSSIAQPERDSPKQTPEMPRMRRASNGLQYLFSPSNGNSRNSVVDQMAFYPPTTPADPNRQQFNEQFSNINTTPALEASEYSPDTPRTSPPVMHPETVFTVSTIIPDFLYLGPEITRQEEVDELESKGVKRILNMAYECEDLLDLNDRFDQYLKLNVKDSVEEDVESGLKIAVDFIDQAYKDQAPIYVHCKAGKSRSVTAVLAYLIQTRRWTLKNAYNYVMERRRGICPNIGFVAELMRVEENIFGVRRSSTTELMSPSLQQEFDLEKRRMSRDDTAVIMMEGVQPSVSAKLPRTAFF